MHLGYMKYVKLTKFVYCVKSKSAFIVYGDSSISNPDYLIMLTDLSVGREDVGKSEYQEDSGR